MIQSANFIFNIFSVEFHLDIYIFIFCANGKTPRTSEIKMHFKLTNKSTKYSNNDPKINELSFIATTDYWERLSNCLSS